MKSLVFILACTFILGCDGEPDSPPVTQYFKCTFTNFTLAKNLTVSFDCLERKQKDSGFSLFMVSENYTSEHYSSNNGRGDNSIIVPEEIIAKCGKIFTCNISLFPYFPTSFDKLQQNNYVGTKLTYMMRIYKDKELLYEKELKFPKKKYLPIKIEL